VSCVVHLAINRSVNVTRVLGVKVVSQVSKNRARCARRLANVNGRRPTRKSFLPPFRHAIGEEEIAEVVDTMRSDWLTTGPKTHYFEDRFKEYVGCDHAVAVSSCTAAMHLSLVAAGIEDGHEVITTPFTFAATAEVIIHQHAKPVFVDIEPDTYNIDVSKIEETIGEQTRAIMPVHYAGHPCDMHAITQIADQHKLQIIEDAAHAFGAAINNRLIGSFSKATCFSFYATKVITTGEGGMVTTNDGSFAEKIRLLSLHGLNKDAWKRYSRQGAWYYDILCPGYKCNMTDIQAAIGIHQLKKAPEMQQRRKDIAQRYTKAFKSIPEITTPSSKKNVQHSWHLYPVLINTDLLNISRNGFIDALRSENIGTSVHFIPLHLHPYYRRVYHYKRGDFPVAESVFDRTVSLPIYSRMTDNDVSDVIASISKVVDEHGI
jgi:dTDP-4-amino-4,6-dideoxygalactose transaminase